MIKLSIVKRATYLNKTWEGHGKTFYFHGIVFENGDFGEYMSITDDQKNFIPGQETQYSLEGSPGKHKIKTVPKEHDRIIDSSGNPAPQKGGNYRPKPNTEDLRSFALSYAKDIIVARIAVGYEKSSYVFDEMELLQLASTCEAYLNGERKNIPLDRQPEEASDQPSDDLPF